MNRHRVFVLGCLGAIMLGCAMIAVTVGGTEASERLPLQEAKLRWAAKGSDHYTLDVSQSCDCGPCGNFEITVTSGKVTDFKLLLDDGWPASHTVTTSDFDRLTVDRVLSDAEQFHHEEWTWPWRRWVTLTYDPTYGYVTQYNTDLNNWGALVFGGYDDRGVVCSYAAFGLVLTQP